MIDVTVWLLDTERYYSSITFNMVWHENGSSENHETYPNN